VTNFCHGTKYSELFCLFGHSTMLCSHMDPIVSAKKWSDLELWTLEPLISQILWQVALSSAKRPVGANFGGHHVTAKAPLTIAQRESLQKKRQDYLCISHHRISTQPGNLVVQR
jgi:hypothetical protein